MQPPNFARSPGTSAFVGAPSPMRFTFPQAVGEPPLKPPVPQPGLPPPHGINSHFGPGPTMGKPQSTNYTVAAGNFRPSGSPLGPSSGPAGEGYGPSPLRPPSVLPQPAPDGPLPCLPHGATQRAGITSPVEKREDPGAGTGNSLAAPELSGTQDPGMSGLSQTELEKQRQVGRHLCLWASPLGFGARPMDLPSCLYSAQRQRLRELLIRQQMQRNTLRQEKETAAAAGAVGPPGNWGAEPSSPAFEQLGRGQTPFAGTQVGRVARGGGSKMLKVVPLSSTLIFPRTRAALWGCPQASWVAPSWGQGLSPVMTDSPGRLHQPPLPLWMLTAGEAPGLPSGKNQGSILYPVCTAPDFPVSLILSITFLFFPISSPSLH